MSLRIHLIIVSFIILIVFAGWQWMRPGAPDQAGGSSPYAIQIVRASYGLNCLYNYGRAPAAATPDSLPAAENSADLPPLRENNVLERLSAFCNLKTRCPLKSDPAWLGFNPAPGCYNKQLSVEYRCFSYDRLRHKILEVNEASEIACAAPPAGSP